MLGLDGTWDSSFDECMWVLSMFSICSKSYRCDESVFWNFEMSFEAFGRMDPQVFDLEILKIFRFDYQKPNIRQPKLAFSQKI